ncbi:MAG: ParB/RepB/Spo0J family partition protein [Chloroflexia bacterium]|nr:ParB/RepB/Spo0J family partition protein [Chloroflexia bacterium]
MEREIRQVPVGELGETWGPKPSERLVENIRANGIVVPLVVAEVTDADGAISYRLVDGNRRLASARLAELETVPALIVRGHSDPELAQMTVLANSMRATNPVTEWWALDDLVRSGSPERSLAGITGMSKSTLANRLTLADLEPRIFEGLARGDVAPTIALSASRLPREIQEQLAGEFERTGTLRKRQVDEAHAFVNREEGSSGEAAALDDPADGLLASLNELAARAVALGWSREEWVQQASDAWASAASDEANETR